MSDGKRPVPWPMCGESTGEIRMFLAQAAERMRPESGAEAAERSFIAGQLIGLAGRLLAERRERAAP